MSLHPWQSAAAQSVPVVSISAGSAVTLGRSLRGSERLEVPLTLGGAALPDTDYALYNIGATSVRMRDDDPTDRDVSLAAGTRAITSGGIDGGTETATVTIVDDD